MLRSAFSLLLRGIYPSILPFNFNYAAYYSPNHSRVSGVAAAKRAARKARNRARARRAAR